MSRLLGLKGRHASAEEKKWMSKVADFGCVVCHKTMRVHSPPDIHHTRGRVNDNCHFYVLPLCPLHHRGQGNNVLYTSRHPNKAAFEERYGTEEELMQWMWEQMGEVPPCEQ